MQLTEIKKKIKTIIYETTNIKPEEIQDGASFADDLELDSLTMLEIAINVDQEFGLDFPEDDLPKLSSVDASAQMVLERMQEAEITAGV